METMFVLHLQSRCVGTAVTEGFAVLPAQPGVPGDPGGCPPLCLWRPSGPEGGAVETPGLLHLVSRHGGSGLGTNGKWLLSLLSASGYGKNKRCCYYSSPDITESGRNNADNDDNGKGQFHPPHRKQRYTLRLYILVPTETLLGAKYLFTRWR